MLVSSRKWTHESPFHAESAACKRQQCSIRIHGKNHNPRIPQPHTTRGASIFTGVEFPSESVFARTRACDGEPGKIGGSSGMARLRCTVRQQWPDRMRSMKTRCKSDLITQQTILCRRTTPKYSRLISVRTQRSDGCAEGREIRMIWCLAPASG